MAITNKDRIQRCLEELRDGLKPFVEQNLKAGWGRGWVQRLEQSSQHPTRKNKDSNVYWDTQLLLKTLSFNWNELFKGILGNSERSYVNELRDVRNDFAHEKPFSSDNTLRALDTAQRLLSAVSAQDQAKILEAMRAELMRTVFHDQARQQTRKKTLTLKTETASGLNPWRDVVTPHKDVASGRYQQAEFAADLAQVHRGEGETEYRDPEEFFRRTYLTQGLTHLLTGALQRLSGKAGDPVVELQTNFGGGKTHSMLALFHLFSGVSATKLAGVDALLGGIGISGVPKANRAVLVGTALSPGQTHTNNDGTVVHTLWGELAWQLGGKDGYALVADSDKTGTSPGSLVIAELLNKYEPALILIDEWIAFVRQLYNVGELPAGSFDANLSFAQSLTEAAKATKKALIVASLPASDNEIGGEGGCHALDRLKNTFSRIESTWKPATAQEGFEIVRRRLFEPIREQNHFTGRDAVLRAFSHLYQGNAAEFPYGTGELDYREQMQAAYPIHPELFKRLYDEWGSLDRFQRTRGVLRLMAAVIHALWESGDNSLLIMPANIPMDNLAVKHELTRYMSEPWDSVISKDIDGSGSTPITLDREVPNLGRLSATRRVSRTIYMGSAPTSEENNPGIDDRSIRLGCAQPGEPISTFGDALRRLAERATFLYVNESRYWFSTKKSVSRLADDRGAQLDIHDVWAKLVERLRQDRKRGDFASVHIVPDGSIDVPDEMEARLVILGPERVHTKEEADSAARKFAEEILAQRGTSPRIYRNMLIFLAPDKQRLSDLEKAVRQYMAWDSILRDQEPLNLTVLQINQAETRRGQAEDAMKARIQETWIWSLVPAQPNPKAAIGWDEARVQGQDTLALQTSRKLISRESLMTKLGPVRLKMVLDKYLWANVDHLHIKKLLEYCASYLYLPRLKNSDVLLDTIQAGIGELTGDNFAYAGSYNEETKRYEGLVLTGGSSIVIDSMSMVVKPDVAQKQVDNYKENSETLVGAQPGGAAEPGIGGEESGGKGGSESAEASLPKEFFGSVDLDSNRLGREAGRIAEDVLQHLSTLPGAEVKVSLEIQATIPDGASDEVQRVITENCAVMKFKTHGFED